MVAITRPQHIDTSLNYFLEPPNGEEVHWYPLRAGDKRRKHDERPVSITDVRGSEGDFTLDQHGFQYSTLRSCEQEFRDGDEWVPDYYKQCEELMKNLTGATEVRALSHVIREKRYEEILEDIKDLDDDTVVPHARTTARFIHVDQSDHGAEVVAHNWVKPEELEKLTKTRWAIVNIWRPFGRPVTREALAVCDARTVQDKELYPVTGRIDLKARGSVKFSTGGRDIEAYFVKADNKHKWYYRSLMQPDDVLLIKNFDSKQTGVARHTPHTAFVGPNDHGPARQSIETRCLVFWEDQTSD